MGDRAGISMGGIFTMHRFILALASFSLFVGTVYAAQPAVDLPNRPIRLLAVSPPGGPGDFVARLVAPRLADALDRNVVVDNPPAGTASKGNVTGMDFESSNNEMYVCEGGELNPYDTSANPVHTNVDIVGKAWDVRAVPPITK